jgi:hypothetical protein
LLILSIKYHCIYIPLITLLSKHEVCCAAFIPLPRAFSIQNIFKIKMIASLSILLATAVLSFASPLEVRAQTARTAIAETSAPSIQVNPHAPI